ncbi:MAG TPA: hypothetical protein VKI65_04930 [Gemmataceae bacterium]|nr:hypothetical protein [Gemmataceae bacterium]
MKRKLVLLPLLCLVLAGCGRRVVSVPPAGDVAAAEPERAAEPFRFPDDRGGRLLAELLPPRETLPPLPADRSSAPLAFPAPRHVERPDTPIPPVQAEPPRLPIMLSLHPSPRSIPEEVPLADYRAEPIRPEETMLPASALVRLPSPDVNEPPSLPILALPVVDRVPIDDPTGEASRQAALSATMPPRAQPAPFIRFNLPDPFEHQRAVRLRTPPAEDSSPPAVVVRRP